MHPWEAGSSTQPYLGQPQLLYPGTGHHKLTCRCFLQSFPMGYAYPHHRGLGNLLLSYLMHKHQLAGGKQQQNSPSARAAETAHAARGTHTFPAWQPASHSQTRRAAL